MRIVVKVGTSTLTNEQGKLDREYIENLARQLAEQQEQGRDVVLVTSGAIRAGREKLALTANESLPFKQAAAAVGQGVLMQTYAEAFSACSKQVAQILLTREDLINHRRYLNARNTLSALFSLHVIPIINENDTVAVDEIKFGDNDTLAARVALLVEADVLLILSDVSGLYRSVETQEVIPVIEKIDTIVESIAGGSESGVGTGGMRTKIEAARIATSSGIPTIIAKGREPHIIQRVIEGESVGTRFSVGKGKLSGRKRWIVSGARNQNCVTVNAGASEKLCKEGASLLAVGITRVEGNFESGATIIVRDEEAQRIAIGLTNYSSDELRIIKGQRSTRFEELLGYRSYDEVIHRDNLILEA